MRIVGRGPRLLTEIRYTMARIGGGSIGARLPLLRMRAEGLPEGCSGVLVTGDLQGVAASPLGGGSVLLGVALADFLTVWAAQGLIPGLDELVAVLTGDLYADPAAAQRGATGPVRDVWLAFAVAGFATVTGVSGNHDLVDPDDLADLAPVVRPLDTGGDADGTVIDVGGMRCSGVGAVIGRSGQVGRRDPAEQRRRLREAVGCRPDLLVLHEGPPGDRADQPGSSMVAACLGDHAPGLTVCGHVGWQHPVGRIAGGADVLNVDGRAVLLTRD